MEPGNMHIGLLADEELCQLLRRRETVFIGALKTQWREVERQVERLGYGDECFVSFTEGPHGAIIKVGSVRPFEEARNAA